ncbi:hypothetical protein DERP_013711 [Dermatophagoides pteronyssinus]|uniref:Uncharacterized protein n=1 Tax=Dermatophagoides pteronyssinus TaxID=6956 RepID=A0ABQ8JV70_DERPT|nr:hypothetical protein DERP_013711 [Dermatophagoides pteronyssinus]
MCKTLLMIQLSRIWIILLTLIFIILTQMQIFHLNLIPWPNYHSLVAIILDLVLLIGLIASIIQHLKMLIFFSWLLALTFLLIFFGNTVSSQYQSDLIGMYYLLVICILSFTDAICIIKYRMPCEESAHHYHHLNHYPLGLLHNNNNNPLSTTTTNKCSPHQQRQQTIIADSTLLPLPPLPLSTSSPSTKQQQQHGTHSYPPTPPPPPFSKSHPHHSHTHHTHRIKTSSSSNIASPSSPPPLHLLPSSLLSSTSALNKSHCYVPKNDPQFHAV